MSNSLDSLRAATKPEGGGFNLDAWHAMDERDNALVADELMHGATSSRFVYSFTGADGETATGVSVVGARHLAAHYGGIRHRIVATLDKRGSACTMMTFPHAETPMSCQIIHQSEWESEADWYRCVVEVCDVKKGNSIQRTTQESSVGRRKDGTAYSNNHYATIAESKAYRNAVLDLIPQDVVMAFKAKALALGRSEDLTADAIANMPPPPLPRREGDEERDEQPKPTPRERTPKTKPAAAAPVPAPAAEPASNTTAETLVSARDALASPLAEARASTGMPLLPGGTRLPVPEAASSPPTASPAAGPVLPSRVRKPPGARPNGAGSPNLAFTGLE